MSLGIRYVEVRVLKCFDVNISQIKHLVTLKQEGKRTTDIYLNIQMYLQHSLNDSWINTYVKTFNGNHFLQLIELFSSSLLYQIKCGAWLLFSYVNEKFAVWDCSVNKTPHFKMSALGSHNGQFIVLWSNNWLLVVRIMKMINEMLLLRTVAIHNG